ncbi:hypothetical protein WN944_004207 [Citrus x changshan-huyou]|uniref:Uncharacterized protein n=1 Tax=Citrus x changshan-huyou TaxID=2935761 RepID=A0AAP0LZZ8_9ROSI
MCFCLCSSLFIAGMERLISSIKCKYSLILDFFIKFNTRAAIRCLFPHSPHPRPTPNPLRVHCDCLCFFAFWFA